MIFISLKCSDKIFSRNWKSSKGDSWLWASPVNEGIFWSETSHSELLKTLSKLLLLAKILVTNKLVDLKIQLMKNFETKEKIYNYLSSEKGS